MRLRDAEKNIGKAVTIGGGDIAIYSHLRKYVFDSIPLTIVKITKSGQVYLKHENDFVTVPAKYLHLCD